MHSLSPIVMVCHLTVCMKMVNVFEIFIACFSGSNQTPEVTSMKYCNGLLLGVGTSTGHVSEDLIKLIFKQLLMAP